MSTEPTEEKPYLIRKEGGIGFEEFCKKKFGAEIVLILLIETQKLIAYLILFFGNGVEINYT